MLALPTAPTPQAPAADTGALWHTMWNAAQPVAETPGAAYLERRSIPLHVATAAGVRWAADWYGRPAVLFPLVDQAGQLVAVNGRHTDALAPKAHTGGPKSLGVFVTPNALTTNPLVIVEAPIDALALTACGMPSVAVAGTSGPRWLASAAALRPVLLALDNDQAGDAAAVKLATALGALGARCERLRPGQKDWADDLATFGRARLATQLAAVLHPDDVAASFRMLLASGALDDYGQLLLHDGTWVLNVPGYVRAKLDTLAWPSLQDDAIRRLQRLHRALARASSSPTTGQVALLHWLPTG
jgi:hypothetical protein